MQAELEAGFRIAAQLLALREPPPADAPDLAWWRPAAESSVDATESTVTLTSEYVSAADGTQLAVDVYLPATLPAGAPLPAILIQTRYLRRPRLSNWAKPLKSILDSRSQDAHRYTAAGYAFVVVDLRGSGASFGFRLGELHEQEASDGPAICAWICAQPWSDGRIATTGVSYEGSAAEHLLCQHPSSIKAAVIRYALFDAYADIICPGGLRASWFAYEWGKVITGMDRDEPSPFLPVDGVATVDTDHDGEQLKAAVREHRHNADLEAAFRCIEFSDDRMPDGRTLAEMSPLRSINQLCGSNVPVYSWSGYLDGAYPAAAVKRYLALSQANPDIPHRLILGPWDHGNRGLADSSGKTRAVGFDYRGEMLRFFDTHLATDEQQHDLGEESSVHYFTMNERRWKHTDIWPPAGFAPTTYYFAANGELSQEPPAADQGSDHYQVDYGATSGLASRWRSYVNPGGVGIGYADRAGQDSKLLVYDSDVLQNDLEVTGHPVVTLFVIANGPDSAFHVYLEELRNDGRVVYVTEGVLRGIHRQVDDNAPGWAQFAPCHSFRRADRMPLIPDTVAEIGFGLLPVSYLFEKGSRIRVACAGADRDNFDRVPSSGPAPVWRVQRNIVHASRISLPQAVQA